jgi:hypothetical protein
MKKEILKEVCVKLNEYFEKTKGLGVLATADASGKVNVAVYSRPHFTDEGDEKTIAFIMADRLSHANIQTNPQAAFLFIEEGQGYVGKRLHLTKVREEVNPELVAAICRRCNYAMYGSESLRYVVFFRVDDVLPLIGPGPG